MGSETNIHRAARKLQRESNLSYAQAREAVIAERAAEGTSPAVGLPGPFDRLTALSVGDRVDLGEASIGAAGVVVELAVDANPNLVRFELAGLDGSEVTLDVRRFTPATLNPVPDEVAELLVFDGHTTEAGDAQMVLALACEVGVERDGDTWVLYAASDPDVVNVVTVDGRVSLTQLVATLVTFGVPRIVDVCDGTVADVLFDEATRERLCEVCRVPAHDVCASDPGCACCVDTMLNTSR